MTAITSQNKNTFKNYLRSNSHLFDSKFLTCIVKNLENLFTTKQTSIDYLAPTKYINFQNGDVIDLTDRVFDSEYIYLPGVANDIIRLKNGSDFITLGFDSFGRLYYGQYLIPLGTQINLDNKKYTVKALGGSLLSVTDIPPGPTYDVVESSTAVNEGDTVTFTVNTTNVADGTTLYYTITGDVDEDDFTDRTLTGSVTITNNTAAFTKTLANDITPIGTEGSESFSVDIRLDSTNGTIVTSSSEVNVADTSVLSYTLSESATTLNEGDSVDFTITTQGVPDGTTLYYTLLGTVNSADFTDGLSSGSFTINNNTATVQKTLLEDLTVQGFENQENFVFQLRTGSTSGPIVATSASITVEDTSISTYTLTTSETSISEGSSVTFTLTTQGVVDGSTLYYSTTSTDVFPTSGSFTISNNEGSFVITANEDVYVESAETFSVTVRTGSVTGSIVATSSPITITNTTAYQISSSSTEVQEDGSVTITVNSEFVPDNSTLYYKVIGSNSIDISNLTGSFIINNNIGSFDILANQDYEIDSGETITVQILTDSPNGTVIETIGPLLILDTAFSVVVTPQQTVIPETTLTSNSSVIFDVTTVGVSDGTQFTAKIIPGNSSVTSADFNGVTSYNFIINNNTASFEVSISRDAKTEGSETFSVDIENLNGIVIATSPSVVITDTSFVGSRKTDKTFGPIPVNRDNGNTVNTSDWYTLCGLDNIPNGSKIVLFLDNSGSMTTDTVRASLNEFVIKLQQKNITIEIVEDSSENWISPFDKDFL